MTCFCLPPSNWRFIETNNTRHASQSFHALLDEQTGDLYLDDPLWLVAVKCFFVFIGTPLYTAGVMIGYFATAVVDLCHGQIVEAGKDLLQVLRSPFHGLLLGLSAVYGVVSPFEGRKFAAFTMQNWNVGQKYHPKERAGFYLAPCFAPRANLLKDRDIEEKKR